MYVAIQQDLSSHSIVEIEEETCCLSNSSGQTSAKTGVKGDIKLFAKNEKELETPIHAIRICSRDIGMEFGIENCAVLVMKSGKRHMTDGMELSNHDRIRMLEENETYKYLGIFEADTIKQVKMKDMSRKEYIRRTPKLLQRKLSSRNLIEGINNWAVPLVRYSGPFLKWTREELKQMDKKISDHA